MDFAFDLPKPAFHILGVSQEEANPAHPVSLLPACSVSGLHSGDTSIGDIDLNFPALGVSDSFLLVFSVTLLEELSLSPEGSPSN